MAYNIELADRVREHVESESGFCEMKMFGGIAFLINGNMAVGASSKGGLMLRVDPKDTESLLRRPEAEPFEMRGRAMSGWLHVRATAETADDALAEWIAHGVRYARSLPAK